MHKSVLRRNESDFSSPRDTVSGNPCESYRAPHGKRYDLPDKASSRNPPHSTNRYMEEPYKYLWETGQQDRRYTEEELCDLMSIAAPLICKMPMPRQIVSAYCKHQSPVPGFPRRFPLTTLHIVPPAAYW